MIEIITGCMFAGKTEELIRRLHRVQYAKQKVQVFKPSIDKRYSESDVMSHNGLQFNAVPVDHVKEVLDMIEPDTRVIAFDEAQFFSEKIIEICETLANKGYRVIVAGLDTDYRGEPFGAIPEIMARAEKVTKLRAVCMVCGEDASFTFRKTAEAEQIVVGEKNIYEARCRKCFNAGRKKA
jgi:thymidine kinase